MKEIQKLNEICRLTKTFEGFLFTFERLISMMKAREREDIPFFNQTCQSLEEIITQSSSTCFSFLLTSREFLIEKINHQ